MQVHHLRKIMQNYDARLTMAMERHDPHSPNAAYIPLLQPETISGLEIELEKIKKENVGVF